MKKELASKMLENIELDYAGDDDFDKGVRYGIRLASAIYEGTYWDCNYVEFRKETSNRD